MTSIDKLSIQGIRSFSPNNAQVIEFYKPLTLIVGKNGSGKTTTIECLKQVTTGELPPNCRGGQAFINDPNALGTSEVKGQIKLRFTSANKRPAVCTRSFSLTQKPQKREYKAFECALKTVTDEGKQQSLSYKASDLNKVVPEMMGVSTAVLDSVIFVHQEDSCWPLSEDKVLKQKFDDIFAATEYTKALDSIKAYRLDKSKDIRGLAAELETLQTRLDTATRLRNDQADAEKMLKELNEGIDQAVSGIQDAKGKLPALKASIDERDALRGKHSQNCQEHANAQNASRDALEMLQKNFDEELEEPDEELNELLTSQGAESIKQAAELDALKTKVTEIEGEIARAERKRDDARATLEQQKAEEAHHKKTEEDALLLIDDLDGEYGIKTSTAAATGREPPAYKAKAATEALSRVLQSRQAELAQAKDKRQHYSSTQGTKVQQLRVKIDHTSEAATQKEKEAADHQMRLRNLQQRVEGGEMAEADETALSRLRQESRDLKAQVEMAEEDVSSSGLSSDIANGKIKRRALKDKLVALNEELANIEREGDKQKKLKTQSEAVQEKKDKLESVITDRRPKLAQVLDVPHNDDVMRLLEMDSIAREMLRRRQQKDDDVEAKEIEAKQAHEKYTRKQNEVYVKQEALRTAEDEVQRVEGELSSIDSLMLTEGYDWEGQQKEMEEKVEEISDRKFGGAQMIKFVEKAIEKAEASATCVLCNQKCDAAAKGSIKKRADQIRDKAINLPGQSETDLHEARTKANKHKRAHEQFLACKKQKNSEIPATQQMLDKLKGEQMTLKREHERLLGEVKELRERSERAKELMRDVDHVKYLYKELQAAQGEFAHTQSGMQSGMHSAVRPKEVVVSERDQAQEDLEQCEKELDEKGNAIEGKRNELAECRARASAKELELSKVVSAMERMKELQTQISDTQQRMSKLQQEARNLRDGERPDREKLHAQENELRAEEQRLDAAVKQHDDRVAKCITDHTKLTDYSNRLSEGSSASRQQMMQDCKARHDEAERTVAGKRESLKETQKRKEEMADRIKGQDRLQMQMRANLQYRDLLAKEKAKKDEMMKSQAALSKADPKANQCAQEYNKLQAKMRDLETERAKFEGSKTTVTRNVENIKVQLKEKQYKRIDAEHREKLIEHKTVQMAVEDLNRYYKALNAALMRFHETKMADINKSITELWNKTYKGSDIDGIAIKTEDEGQTADGRRKQTYRVVMRKGDSTLDMRGRCSAGQKVLASLVIRLALAETFCINCGIMTLDEPTTNLDRANIESLAQAINEIIKNRKQQANFQLIVITHDEEFVQLIGRSENCSHYYWIEKKFHGNEIIPSSTITKKSIDRFG